LISVTVFFPSNRFKIKVGFGWELLVASRGCFHIHPNIYLNTNCRNRGSEQTYRTPSTNSESCF